MNYTNKQLPSPLFYPLFPVHLILHLAFFTQQHVSETIPDVERAPCSSLGQTLVVTWTHCRVCDRPPGVNISTRPACAPADTASMTAFSIGVHWGCDWETPF